MGWYIYTLWDVSDKLLIIKEDNAPREMYFPLENILFLSGIFITALSGIFLFLFMTDFWKQDLSKFLKSKNAKSCFE